MLLRSLSAGLVVVLMAPGAVAQYSSSLDVTIEGVGAVPEGQPAPFHLAVRRNCHNAAFPLPAQEVAVRLEGLEGAVLQGPASLTFERHTCATGTTQQLEADYQVILPADAQRNKTHVFELVVEAQDTGDVAYSEPEPARQALTVAWTEEDPVPVEPAASSATKKSPVSLLPLLGVAGLAAALVRRSSR